MTIVAPTDGDPLDPAWAELITDAVNGLVESLTNRPYARLRQTAAQTIGTGAATALTFNAEDYDTGNGHSTVTNTSRYTFPYTGVVLLMGGVSWAFNATGLRGLNWQISGSAIDGSGVLDQATAATAGNRQAARSIIRSVTAAQYVELMAFQNSGGNLDTAVNTVEQPSMDVFYLLRT